MKEAPSPAPDIGAVAVPAESRLRMYALGSLSPAILPRAHSSMGVTHPLRTAPATAPATRTRKRTRRTVPVGSEEPPGSDEGHGTRLYTSLLRVPCVRASAVVGSE